MDDRAGPARREPVPGHAAVPGARAAAHPEAAALPGPELGHPARRGTERGLGGGPVDCGLPARWLRPGDRVRPQRDRRADLLPPTAGRPGRRRTGTGQPMNLNGVGRYWARWEPDATAIRWAGQDISWAELELRTQGLASGLQEIGLRPGDRVGILAGNCPEWCELTLATLRAGAVVVPMSP